MRTAAVQPGHDCHRPSPRRGWVPAAACGRPGARTRTPGVPLGDGGAGPLGCPGALLEGSVSAP
eukprot:9250415-Pyramimonas_sp.AAC.1